MQKYDFSLEATGTLWKVSLWTRADKKDSQKLWESCLLNIENFEGLYSRFDKNSFLRGLTIRSGEIDVEKDFVQMLAIYKEFNILTDGLFTPLGGALISDLGYDADYTLKSKAHNDEVPSLEEGVHVISSTKIEIKKNLHFDLGALGKGFLVDKILEKIKRDQAVERILINAGGDIAHWAKDGAVARIALENPYETQQAIGVVEIGNQSIACSSSYKRMWGEGEHHIHNPKKKKSAEGVVASWVIHDSAAYADAIATALFFSDFTKISEKCECQCATLAEGGELRFTDFFDNSFFTK